MLKKCPPLPNLKLFDNWKLSNTLLMPVEIPWRGFRVTQQVLFDVVGDLPLPLNWLGFLQGGKSKISFQTPYSITTHFKGHKYANQQYPWQVFLTLHYRMGFPKTTIALIGKIKKNCILKFFLVCYEFYNKVLHVRFWTREKLQFFTT